VDNSTVYTDETAAPGTTYTYTVTAYDAAGNASLPASASVTTPTTGGGSVTLKFAPTDDATIDAANPTANAGTSNRLVVDASPVNDFLMKFTVAGTGPGTTCATISSAKLRMTVGNGTDDKSVKGGDFRGAVNSNWAEGTVTWATAPAANAGPPVASISTAVAVSTAYTVDVSPLVTGNNTFTIRASGLSSDGARYYSKNGNAATLAPELQVTCG
jgi:hypothetical protein